MKTTIDVARQTFVELNIILILSSYANGILFKPIIQYTAQHTIYSPTYNCRII